MGLKGSLRKEPERLKSDAQVTFFGLRLPFLSLSGYYNFLSTLMIVLFIIGLVIIFVYEYEMLRRQKS